MKNHDLENTEIIIPDERLDLRISQSLRRIVRSIDIHSRKLHHEYDITAPQLLTLTSISENEPLTIASLSINIHLSSSTLVGIIDRLENKNLVVRQRDTKDRRKVMIHTTDKGKVFIASAPSLLQETMANSLAKLTELEQSTIALSLERVVELMEAQDLDAAPLLETGAIDRSTS